MSLHQFVVLLHLFGAGVMIGLAFFSVVLSLDKPLDERKLKTILFIRRFGTYAVFWLFLTGLHLLQEHDFVSLKSPRFWTKMGLILLDGALAHVLISKKINEALDKRNFSLVDKLPTWMWTSAVVIALIVTLGYYTTISH